MITKRAVLSARTARSLSNQNRLCLAAQFVLILLRTAKSQETAAQVITVSFLVRNTRLLYEQQSQNIEKILIILVHFTKIKLEIFEVMC